MGDLGITALREEIREWIRTKVPAQLRTSVEFTDKLAIDRLLAASGYLCYNWPVEYGGADAGALAGLVLQQELARAGMPLTESPSRLGIRNVAPALMQYGSDEQKTRLLGAISAVQELWCQGFSEPEAGSDLAGVRCRAEIGATTIVLTGRKIWTTNAHRADWCMVLARSADGPRYKNLSVVLVPMDRPGVTVRPIRQIDGSSGFNEVTFDEVEVPVANLLGPAGSGWSVAMTTLSAERTLSTISMHALVERDLARLGQMLREEPRDAELIELGRLLAGASAVENLAHLVTARHAAGAPLGVLPSIVKLVASETRQAICSAGLQASMRRPTTADAGWFSKFVTTRKHTIAGGTTQVQLNVIAERGLGLPRERKQTTN